MTLIKSIFSFICTFAFFALMAQPSGPPATPLDGGLSLLLAAGGLYGIRKLNQIKD